MPSRALVVRSLANYSLNASSIFATGLVDHASGTLNGFIEMKNSLGGYAQGTLWVNARDVFTVTGPTHGETISITARLRVDGVYSTTAVNGAQGRAEALLAVGPGYWNTVNGGIGTTDGTSGLIFFNIWTPAGNHPYDIEGVHTFDVVTGTPFDLAYTMKLFGDYADVFPAGDLETITQDSLKPGQLSFDLPDENYVVTSDLGYSSAPAAIPMLGGTGRAGLALGLVLASAFAFRRMGPRPDFA